VFQAVDAKHENLVIYNLDSGIGVVPTALVRWSDVLSMTTQGDGDASAGWCEKGHFLLWAFPRLRTLGGSRRTPLLAPAARSAAVIPPS